MPTKPNGDTDWSKFFMALAAGIVFTLQGVSQIQLSNHSDELKSIDKTIVDRGEIIQITKTMRNHLIVELKHINKRLDSLEELEKQRSIDTKEK